MDSGWINNLITAIVKQIHGISSEIFQDEFYMNQKTIELKS